ncbi:MAG: hypothetical protein HYS52_01510 [Candidatus Wildermuthbacteria bacterium]|nr:hypothetical protein [Candidatus Wildermuthbacteria bacterium]
MSSSKKQRGAALYLAVLVMSMILGVSFGIHALLLGQIKTLTGLGHSVFAFGASDAGIEKIFYDDQKGIDILAQCPEGSPAPDPSQCTQTLSNGAAFTITVSAPGAGCTASSYCAKSAGAFQNALRAIRLAR